MIFFLGLVMYFSGAVLLSLIILRFYLYAEYLHEYWNMRASWGQWVRLSIRLSSSKQRFMHRQRARIERGLHLRRLRSLQQKLSVRRAM